MNHETAPRRGRFAAWLCCGFCLATISNSDAQVMLSPAFEKPDIVADELKTEDHIVIHPQSQPDPMLRHRLWPAPEKRRQRPAMTAVNRALLLVAQVPASQKRHFLEHFEEWSKVPFYEIPIAEAKASYGPFETAIGVLRDGENWMDLRYDLGIEDMSTSEKLGTLLPEYQEMRDLARLLCIRARVAAAEDRWDDAISELRLGFRLSEVASHSTDVLLGRLVGAAIAGVMLDSIESMIQDPDCPNLYWALAALPVDRLFEMREAIEYESTLAYHVGSVAGLGELPGDIIGPEMSLIRIKEIVDAFSTSFSMTAKPEGVATWSQMTSGVHLAMMVGPSRELLAESPDWKNRVAQLSDAEAVLRASDFELSRIRDRWLAWALLPSTYRHDYSEQRQSAMNLSYSTVTLGGQLARRMLPAVDRAAAVGLDMKQQHHRLVTLEALRMHAAQSGSLPANLQTLLPVPAWHDPIAQKPFLYVRHSPSEASLTCVPGARKRDDITIKIKLENHQ